MVSSLDRSYALVVVLVDAVNNVVVHGMLSYNANMAYKGIQFIGKCLRY